MEIGSRSLAFVLDLNYGEAVFAGARSDGPPVPTHAFGRIPKDGILTLWSSHSRFNETAKRFHGESVSLHTDLLAQFSCCLDDLRQLQREPFDLAWFHGPDSSDHVEDVAYGANLTRVALGFSYGFFIGEPQEQRSSVFDSPLLPGSVTTISR
jgi:hypothetical protein